MILPASLLIVILLFSLFVRLEVSIMFRLQKGVQVAYRVIGWSALVFSVVLLMACSEREVIRFTIKNAIVKEMPPGRDMGVAYVTIENQSERDLILNYVHSPIADTVEVHRHIYSDGKMMMREVNHLNIQARSTLTFTPGAYHLMLFSVLESPKAGMEIPLTFEFEGEKPYTVMAEVKRL